MARIGALEGTINVSQGVTETKGAQCNADWFWVKHHTAPELAQRRVRDRNHFDTLLELGRIWTRRLCMSGLCICSTYCR